MTKQIIRKHHYMVTAQVVFVSPEDKNADLVVLLMNSVLLTEKHQVNYKDLARAQQTFHASLGEKMGVVCDVRDIVFTNISYMGYMSEPEFKQSEPVKEA